jgi:hypothetical protein
MGAFCGGRIERRGENVDDQGMKDMRGRFGQLLSEEFAAFCWRDARCSASLRCIAWEAVAACKWSLWLWVCECSNDGGHETGLACVNWSEFFFFLVILFVLKLLSIFFSSNDDVQSMIPSRICAMDHAE